MAYIRDDVHAIALQYRALCADRKAAEDRRRTLRAGFITNEIAQLNVKVRDLTAKIESIEAAFPIVLK